MSFDDGIYKQFKKCGKATCRCAGGALHGPYYYRFYREDRRLKKQYLRKAEVPPDVLAEGIRRKRHRGGPLPRRPFSILEDIIKLQEQLDRMFPAPARPVANDGVKSEKGKE